jgi:hypothetical protein
MPRKKKDQTKPHILVATPMYGGMCTGFYTQSMIQLPTIARNAGVDVSFSYMFNESLIQRARNALVHAFHLRPECTHLMFVDADIRFNPVDIITMLHADKDIICGIYPKKEINWAGVHMAAEQGVPADQLTRYTGSMVVNLVDYQGTVTVPVDKPLRIWNGGTGFMLIKREVFDKLKKKVKTYRNDVGDLGGTVKPQDLIYEYFPVMIEKESNRLLSEDYAFCKIARDNKIDVWAAPWVQLGHFGSYLFEGGLIPAP